MGNYWTVKYNFCMATTTRSPSPVPGEPATPSRRGRPRDPEREQRILEAAGAHFYAHGFERASVDAIAADAGVSKMTVYSRFGSKEGLFEAVIHARTDSVVAAQADARAMDPAHPEATLTAIGEQFLALTRDDSALGQFRTLYAAAGAQPEACAAFHRQGADRLIGELAEYLRAANAAGTLVVPKPRLAADLFLGMFLGDGHIRAMLKLPAPDVRQDRAQLREAVRVFMAAYGARR